MTVPTTLPPLYNISRKREAPRPLDLRASFGANDVTRTHDLLITKCRPSAPRAVLGPLGRFLLGGRFRLALFPQCLRPDFPGSGSGGHLTIQGFGKDRGGDQREAKKPKSN